MVSKYLLMVAIMGVVLLGTALGATCHAKPELMQHIYILTAPEQPDMNVSDNWHILERSEYKTDCWGICPSDVIRRNSVWVYNKAIGIYKLINGIWERQV